MSWYRIQAVADQLGVPAATLRAWERRYGVPSPSRTASAYRLYGDADVRVIKIMRDLVQGGMAPAEAARLVLTDLPTTPVTAPPPSEGLDPYATASERIVAATIAFDPDALLLETTRALTLGPAVSIFERAFSPALTRIGELWHDGSITIAHEHLASQMMSGTLSSLLRLSQPVDASRKVALACFADEDHQIGLYGVALHFTSWGFRAVMIGARTPPAAVGRVVEMLAPDAVALSVTIGPEPSRARELVDAYADACRETPWVVGGHAAGAVRPWVEARGGLTAPGGTAALRKQIERAIAARRRAERT